MLPLSLVNYRRRKVGRLKQSICNHVTQCHGVAGGGVSRIVYKFGPLVCSPGSRKPILRAQLDVTLGRFDIGRTRGSNPPTNVASTLDSIEQALNRHGVIPFSTPTPGVRLL